MAGGRARYLRANRDKYGKRTAMSPADLSRRGGGCVGRTRVSTSVPARRTRVSTPVGAALPAARRCAVLLMLDDLDIHRGVCCPFSGQKRKKNPRTPTSVFISVIRCASRIEHRGRTGRYHSDHELPRPIPNPWHYRVQYQIQRKQCGRIPTATFIGNSFLAAGGVAFRSDHSSSPKPCQK